MPRTCARAGQMHFDVVVKNGATTRFPLVLNLPAATTC
ncbi:Uncharacterised protein [Chromobacterium violaceum]|uniref:Uncharacterized protein n=1 Tax=Chromobacterium violaceum TaxID=536 RepID=A0A447TLL7_CHRVL|nr:Uncharacterised protein [Chromobacterium violaceum]